MTGVTDSTASSASDSSSILKALTESRVEQLQSLVNEGRLSWDLQQNKNFPDSSAVSIEPSADVVNEVIFTLHYAAQLEYYFEVSSNRGPQQQHLSICMPKHHLAEKMSLSCFYETFVSHVGDYEYHTRADNPSPVCGLQLTYAGDLGQWLCRQKVSLLKGQLSSGLVYKSAFIDQKEILSRLFKSGALALDDCTAASGASSGPIGRYSHAGTTMSTHESSSHIQSNVHVNSNTWSSEGRQHVQATGKDNQTLMPGAGGSTGYCVPLQSPNSETWNRYFAALSEYIKEYGQCNLPLTTSVYECTVPSTGRRFCGNLSVWLFSQRLAKRGLLGRAPLTPQREALLQTLADQGKFAWDSPDILVHLQGHRQPTNMPQQSILLQPREVARIKWLVHYIALVAGKSVHDCSHSSYSVSFHHFVQLLLTLHCLH